MKAIVTGAAGGIGRAIAQSLARASANAGESTGLLLVDQTETGIDETVATLDHFRCDVATVVADLADPEAAREVVAAAQRKLGGVDTLISNAGIILGAELGELTIEHYEQTFAVNTRATWLLARAAYPLLRESGGTVVATASICGEEPTPPSGAYSASKAALIMLVRQMANEWGADGIRCNCVSPGLVATPMTAGTYDNLEEREARAACVPLGRIGEPDDIADVVAFLVSNAARYITGVNLVVDGGLQTGLMRAVRRLGPAQGSALASENRGGGDGS